MTQSLLNFVWQRWRHFIVLDDICVVVEAINTFVGDFDVFENLCLIYALVIIVVKLLK